MILTKIIFILLLGLILFQDFRYQAVPWILFPIGLLISIYISITGGLKSEIFFNYSSNLLFIAFQLGIIYLFTWYKNRKRMNIFKSSFGLGDFLFFLMLVPLFSPINFMIFFLSSVLFSLMFYFLLKIIGLYTTEKVPLAGFQSLFLVCLLIVQFIIDFNLYNDFLIIDKLNLL